MTTATDLERSTFQKRPCYRYIRASDELPTYAQLMETIGGEGEDPLCKVKLFTPTGGWTWYIAAYDPDTRIAWGLVIGHHEETGSFSMEELVEWRGRFGLPIERDLYWKPARLSELESGAGRR